MLIRNRVGLGTLVGALSLLATASSGAAEKPQFLNSPRAVQLDRPFSEAVHAGDFLFLSGQIGEDPATAKLPPGGIEPESRQVLANVKRVLEANGATLSDVVKCTVFLADIGEWATFNNIYREVFKKPFPARSALGANGLAMNARVELECVAYLPQKRGR
ncbi:RidA family protein [Peristeroidobacter soli]|jgi:reactive intermediate/imine deaminase|uniref:RidA family protein n=1 Tax=Peristeroidobacter soli TaxID=2497877 RepID=UPI00101BBE65|nr:Rid family detoxifying hydrolase [Peristeroidobacter soli]